MTSGDRLESADKPLEGGTAAKGGGEPRTDTGDQEIPAMYADYIDC